MTMRWKVASLALGVLAAGGAGAAFAASGGGHVHRPALVGTSIHREMRGEMGVLSAAASYLGTTPSALVDQLRSGKTLAQIANQTSGKSADGLIAALVADAKQKLAAAVTAGKVSQAQAETIGANLQQRITDLVNGTRHAAGGPFHYHFGFRVAGGGLAAAVTYLGTTPSALVDQLRSGKTLAQIADQTSGKSASGLIATLVADAKQRIAAAVTANELTHTQADMITASLQQRITDLVNGTRPVSPGPFRPGFGFGVVSRGLAAAASYLGTTPSALVNELRSGKTLAHIANQTSGKSAEGLIGALVADAKQMLSSAVSANRLSQVQADEITSKLQQVITDLVNGTRPALPGHRFGGGFGFSGPAGQHGHWGGAPPSSATT